ncbi:MAG: DUF2461 domain-containing protein [Pirellulaceae bacterium]
MAPHFTQKTFSFLKSLSKNNNREWFNENKEQYETLVREPALTFISDCGPKLEKCSPMFRAEAKKVGGSLMRVFRDTRFSKDKTPYKTNVGIHFRHEMGKDVHCPGYYVHLQPGQCFLGVGIWHPDSETLGRIRQAVADDPATWKKVRDQKSFASQFQLSGDSLQRPPKGYDSEHPMIEDLKRKDFIAVANIKDADVCKPDFLKATMKSFDNSKKFMEFLCNSIGLPF